MTTTTSRRCEACGKALPKRSRKGTRFCPGSSACRMRARRASLPVTFASQPAENPQVKPSQLASFPSHLSHPEGDGFDLAAWRFRDPATRSVLTLAEPWPGQREFWRLMHEHERIIELKQRQLGMTTAALAFVGEHFLTTENCQVNVLSREEGSALDLLERVRYGLAGLDTVFDRETYSLLETGTDTEDLRRIEAFTSARDATRGRTASLVLLDEWAAMLDPERILRAVEPTSPRIIILMTSAGAEAPTSDFYRRSESGKTGFHAVFFGDEAHPERTPKWRAEKEAVTDALTMQREYPLTSEQALAAGGSHVFQSADLSSLDQYAGGRRDPQEGAAYVVGVDLASKRGGDKAAYVVLEALDPEKNNGVRWEVVHYLEFEGTDYAIQGAALRSLHERFNTAVLAVEETGVGAGFLDMLDIREEHIVRMQTTQASKARRLGRLEVAVRTRALVWEPEDFPELHQAALGATWSEHVPDAIMALSFALATAEEGRAVAARKPKRGRAMRVVSVGGGSDSDRVGWRCVECQEIRPLVAFPSNDADTCRRCLSSSQEPPRRGPLLCQHGCGAEFVHDIGRARHEQETHGRKPVPR